MRIVFMGTPEFAVKPLSELIANGHEVVCVYTQPPAPKGRGQKLTPSPVHQFSQLMGIEVRTPKSMKTPVAMADFQTLKVDAGVVVAYGQILKREILDHPTFGCFNLHASLLPRWRGAAPIHRAIMAGDPETGIDVMRMSEGLDEGPVILSARTPIEPNDTVSSLHDRLSHLGAQLLPVALAAIERGGAQETPQLGEVTYAHKITNDEARIDWTRSAQELDWHIRGLSPFPGAFAFLEGETGPVRVKCLMSRWLEGEVQVPGEICDGAGIRVGTGRGVLDILSLQREGKSVQTAEDFRRGLNLRAGQRFL